MRTISNLGVIGLVTIFGAISPTSAIGYTVTDLGTLGGTTSNAFAISENGIVAGSSSTGAESHGFRWQAGSMTDLSVLAGTHHRSDGFDVNDAGIVVGRSAIDEVTGSSNRAVAWSGSAPVALGSLGGGYGVARGINHWGDSVGISGDANGVTHAFIVSGGSMNDLNISGSPNFSDAFDINDSGAVTGNGVNPSGNGFAFRWIAGVTTALPPITGLDQSYGYRINASGHVVGESYTGSLNRPTLWKDALPISIGTLAGLAHGINDADEIVGVAGAFPFLWDEDNGMRNLNTLIDPLSGWTLLDATDINNMGFIVGSGVNPNGETHAYLLTPVPEPASGIAAVVALSMLTRGRKQR